jgi:hypothetical protein
LRAAEGLERAQWQDEHRRNQPGNHNHGATVTAVFAYKEACELEEIVRGIFGAACPLLVQLNAPRPPRTATRFTKNALHEKQTICLQYRDSTVRTTSARLQIRSELRRPNIHQRLDIQEAPLRRVRPLHTIQEPLFTPNRTIKDQNTLLTHPARPLALLPLLARGPCMLRHQHKRRGRQRQGQMRARA